MYIMHLLYTIVFFGFCMFTQWLVRVPAEALIFFNMLSVIFTSLFLLLGEIVARDLHCKCNCFPHDFIA